MEAEERLRRTVRDKNRSGGKEGGGGGVEGRRVEGEGWRGRR